LLPNKIPLSLYVHLPWCEARCPYCDFSITTEPVNGNDTKLAEAIIKDINRSKDLVMAENLKPFILAEAPHLLPPLNQ
jgi:oxygen-independent coproporphyrinogen-3 oxidase